MSNVNIRLNVTLRIAHKKKSRKSLFTVFKPLSDQAKQLRTSLKSKCGVETSSFHFILGCKGESPSRFSGLSRGDHRLAVGTRRNNGGHSVRINWLYGICSEDYIIHANFVLHTIYAGKIYSKHVHLSPSGELVKTTCQHTTVPFQTW